jgi:dienelactone hydrolase
LNPADMRTFWRFLGAVVVIVYLLSIWWLGRLQRLGPPHFDTTLASGIPATVYLPGGPGSLAPEPFPPPPQSRPPVVVLLHGYSADRASMSTLARRLALNGIAVISIDFAGHGVNRNPFPTGYTDQVLVQETRTAVNYARTFPLVDGSRIVVMGHSMGAGTALDYAQHDKAITGAVMISGGFDLYGPERPRNALFIYAQHDPDFIRTLAREIGANLAGSGQIEPGKIYGDIKAGTAVEAIEVPGVDHIRILFSDVATSEILNWCDRLFGLNAPRSPDLGDTRLQAQLIAFALFIVLLFFLGFGLGAVAPVREPRITVAAPGSLGLLGLGIALLAALPLVSTYVPAHFLALDTGDVLISWLSIAGFGIMGFLALTRNFGWTKPESDLAGTLLTVILGFALIYAMQVPRDVSLHNLAFTPERLVAFIFGTILLVPFFLAFEMLTRRGGPWISPLLGIIGRAIIIGVLILGLAAHIIPFVVGLLLPILVLFMIEFEIVAATIYARSGNIAAAALLESAWLAWMLAAIMPITIMI